MTGRSLNQILAITLNAVMQARKLSNSKLASMSGVAEATIRNYRKAAADPERTSSGKERSAKLAEVQLLADALKLHPLALLTDPADIQRRAGAIAQALAEADALYSVAPAPPASPSSKQHKRAA